MNATGTMHAPMMIRTMPGAPAPARRGSGPSSHTCEQPGGSLRSRLLSSGFIGAGLAMVPWLFALGSILPAGARAGYSNTAWVGLDALEAAGLFGTGVFLRRRSRYAGLTAAATSMLLFIDAWFDVLTCAPGDRPLAIAMAVCLEIPIGTLCAAVAVRSVAHPPAADRS